MTILTTRSSTTWLLVFKHQSIQWSRLQSRNQIYCNFWNNNPNKTRCKMFCSLIPKQRTGPESRGGLHVRGIFQNSFVVVLDILSTVQYQHTTLALSLSKTSSSPTSSSNNIQTYHFRHSEKRLRNPNHKRKPHRSIRAHLSRRYRHSLGYSMA